MKIIDLSNSLPVHPTKKYKLRNLSDIKRVVVHTVNREWTPVRLATYDITPYYVVGGRKIYNHISKSGCPAITYAELFMPDGTIYHTLPWEEISYHVGVWNNSSLGVALMYRCTDGEGVDTYAPTKEALQALFKRVGGICLILGLTPDKVVGHRELRGTGWFWFKGSRRFRKLCPGLQVNMDEVRIGVAKYMQLVLKIDKFYRGSIDGIFGAKSKKALEEYSNG